MAPSSGDVQTGSASQQTVTLFNCSEQRTLEISGATLSSDGGGAFSVELPEAVPFTLLPSQSSPLTLEAASDMPREAIGSLVVESDDPEQGAVTVGVRANFVEP